MYNKLICPRCKTENWFFTLPKKPKCYNCYHTWKNPQKTLFDYEV